MSPKRGDLIVTHFLLLAPPPPPLIHEHFLYFQAQGLDYLPDKLFFFFPLYEWAVSLPLTFSETALRVAELAFFFFGRQA